jgi:hypothetical protein
MNCRADFFLPRYLLHDFFENAAPALHACLNDFDELLDAAQWIGIHEILQVSTKLGASELIVRWAVREVELDLFCLRCEAPLWVLEELQEAHGSTLRFAAEGGSDELSQEVPPDACDPEG